MKLLTILAILFAFTGCTKDELQPSEVSKTPEEITTPKENGTSAVANSVPALPDPINPSGRSLLLKQLKNNFTMYTMKEMVDTTVYHYNTNGEVIAEFSTYLNVADSKIHSGSKKYNANPDNINVPDKIYATVLTSVNNYTKMDYIYCDDQKRVIKEIKDGLKSYLYEYDNQGRLSRVLNEYNKEVTLYKYFERSETKEGKAYYTVQTIPQGSSTAGNITKYILSNSVKSQPSPNYFFNYGKVQEYAVESVVTNENPEYSYSYILSDDRVSEKKFKVGQLDFWIKFVY